MRGLDEITLAEERQEGNEATKIVGRIRFRLTATFQFHIKPFHNRCPLIIEPKDYERWLSPAEPSHLPVELVRTFPAEGMKAWRVAKLKGNGPHLVEPLVESWESA